MTNPAERMANLDSLQAVADGLSELGSESLLEAENLIRILMHCGCWERCDCRSEAILRRAGDFLKQLEERRMGGTESIV